MKLIVERVVRVCVIAGAIAAAGVSPAESRGKAETSEPHRAAQTQARPQPKVRISAWYWLNSAPKDEWARDFTNMARLGFTDVVLGWGIDLAAAGLRIDDTRDALRAADRAGLGAYLIIWHPDGNSLPRKPEFMQVNVDGRETTTFDVFNKEWRDTQWKEYLQRVARAYANEPGLVGYVFDDSFMNGPAAAPPPLRRDSDYFSYNSWEKKTFGEPLPKSPKDARWQAWVEARVGWLEDWARDTVRFIREAEGERGGARAREIYLEDLDYILNPIWREKKGIDLPRIARHFDAFGTYTMAGWDDSLEAGRKAAEVTPRVLGNLRRAMGKETKLVYTFWIANEREQRLPGPAKYPTVAHIRAIVDAALAEGVTHIDMYGYRIGDPNFEFAARTPGAGPTYPLTGQFPNKFLWDRPELHEELGAYLRGLNAP